MKNQSVFSVLRATLKKELPLTAALLLAMICSVVCSLLPPLVLGEIVDRLLGGAEVTFLTGCMYFLTLGASALSDTLKEMTVVRFGQRFTLNIRSAMVHKLSRLPADRYVKWEPGAVAARIMGDADTVEALFTTGAMGMAADLCKVAGIIAVIFTKSLGLGLLLLLVTPLLFLFTRWVQKQMLAARKDYRAAAARVTALVPETVRNIRMIRVFGKETHMEAKYDRRIGESYEAMERSNFFDAVYSPVILCVSALVVSMLMTLSALGGPWQALFGMSVGTAVTVIAYVGKVFGPLESIGMEIQNIQSALAGVSRIDEFFGEPERLPRDEGLRAGDLLNSDAPAAELSGLTFSYDGERPVLKDLSLRIERGERVTLTGRTGAGKSTVFKLLLGLISPEAGSAKVLGAEADRIPDGEKRKIFGYVAQEFLPVPGTVLDQIALFDGQVNRDSAVRAAELALIAEDIEALPQGYDTPYSDGLFSQGQKQLLSIARAAAGDPAILLLDEITANLDRETEERVLAALNNAAGGRTMISISHRLPEGTAGRRISIE